MGSVIIFQKYLYQYGTEHSLLSTLASSLLYLTPLSGRWKHSKATMSFDFPIPWIHFITFESALSPHKKLDGIMEVFALSLFLLLLS